MESCDIQNSRWCGRFLRRELSVFTNFLAELTSTLLREASGKVVLKPGQCQLLKGGKCPQRTGSPCLVWNRKQEVMFLQVLAEPLQLQVKGGGTQPIQLDACRPTTPTWASTVLSQFPQAPPNSFPSISFLACCSPLTPRPLQLWLTVTSGGWS